MSGAMISLESIISEVKEIQKNLNDNGEYRKANMLDCIQYDKKRLFREKNMDIYNAIYNELDKTSISLKLFNLTGLTDYTITHKLIDQIEELYNDYKSNLLSEMINCMENTIVSDVDGKGHRLVVFVPSCPHNCKGCQNNELQNKINIISAKEIYNILKDQISSMNIIDGITISGGDPLSGLDNIRSTSIIVKIIKLIAAELNKELNIWIYTGNVMTYEMLENMLYMKIFADVVVDGPYIEETPNAIYRGSNNQCLIDVKKSWDKKEICFVDESTLI